MKAKNSTGTSGFSPSASGTPAAATAVPGTPDTPIVTRGDGTLIVTWTPVSGATAYEVRYGTGSATTLVGEFTGTSAVITGLANGTLYRVRIRARNSEGYSGYSGNAVAVIAPAVPRVTLGNTQLGVTWTAVTQAAAYEVWFGTADNSTSAQRFSGDFTGTSADITGLTNGTTYYVWVKAKSSSNGTSGFSPSASGTPQWPDVTLGYADGNIILTDRTGAVISAITLSKAGSPQTITLNAGDAFTGVGWYIDGAGTGTVSSKITLNASAYSVNKHYVTFTGWRNGAYVSSAIPFTVTN
jgi:hypothetical protein